MEHKRNSEGTSLVHDEQDMKYHIDPAALDKTHQCKYNFSCLSGDSTCLCEVESSLDNKLIFVKPLNFACNYHMSYGYSHICNCPIRKEIYHSYRE